MNKNFKVITINGIRGMIVVAFLIFGLIAGFVISPGWVCMHIWNYFFENSTTVSLMNIYQGIMLWVIIALSLYALNNKRALIGFGSYQGLSSEQIKDIMQKAKDADLDKLEILEQVKNNINALKLEENNLNSSKQDVKKIEEDTQKMRK